MCEVPLLPSWIQGDGVMGLRRHSLALQIRQSPETGHEELVVVGGYYTSVLAEMKPFTLDLETLVWHCWEGVEPAPPDASGPSQSAAAQATPKLPGLPEPRQRMAAQRISHDWLLISGGSPASVRTARLGPQQDSAHRLTQAVG